MVFKSVSIYKTKPTSLKLAGYLFGEHWCITHKTCLIRFVAHCFMWLIVKLPDCTDKIKLGSETGCTNESLANDINSSVTIKGRSIV